MPSFSALPGLTHKLDGDGVLQDPCEQHKRVKDVPRKLKRDVVDKFLSKMAAADVDEDKFEWEGSMDTLQSICNKILKTKSYTMERQAFGGSLANLQTVSHKLAEMKTDICVARAFVDQCIAQHADHKLDSATASMAKYWCTDLQSSVADRGVQLHGGWGYMWEYDVCKHFVDARVQSIYGGANEIMKELIARSI